jgi:hypothetical protein
LRKKIKSVFQKARLLRRAFFTLADNAGTTVKLKSNPRDLAARDVSARLSKVADRMAFMHAQSGNKRGRLVCQKHRPPEPLAHSWLRRRHAGRTRFGVEFKMSVRIEVIPWEEAGQFGVAIWRDEMTEAYFVGSRSEAEREAQRSDGKKFAGDKYVACMTAEGESP